MIKAQIVKDDATLDKYNIDAVTSFIRTILADMGETYRRSSIGQLKVLISSVFPTGVAWNYTGTLDCTISPLYQYIRTFSEQPAPSGAPDVILARLPEFIRLFLSDGLLPDLVYVLGLKNA